MSAVRPISLAKLEALEVHPFAELFPFAADDVITGIAERMAQQGFRQDRPIIFLDGKILDGRNRRKALTLAVAKKGKPIGAFCKVYDGPLEPLDWVLSENLDRRHLSESQRAVIAANLAQWERGLNQHTAGSAHGQTQKQAAKMLGVGERTVARARAILERSPELAKAVSQGGLKVRTAADLIKLGDKELSETLAMENRQIIDRAKQIRETNAKAGRNTGAGLGNKTRTNEERGLNFHETPQCAIDTLLELETFSPTVIAPACGRGAISLPMQARGYQMILSDIIDRGAHTENGEPATVRDWMKTPLTARFDVVENPPFNIANEFIAHAIRGMLGDGGAQQRNKIAMLLNLNFLCGFDDPERVFCMDEHPPARIYVFTRRLPMMHQDGWDGNEASSSMNTGWFVWERGHVGPPQIIRVDWKDHSKAETPVRCPCDACVTRLESDIAEQKRQRAEAEKAKLEDVT